MSKTIIEVILPGLMWSILLWMLGKSTFWVWGGQIRSNIGERILRTIKPAKPRPSRSGRIMGVILVNEAYLFMALVLVISIAVQNLQSKIIISQCFGIIAVFLPGLISLFFKE
ncbi:MAG: hypothetical protein ACYC56_03030 [Candidatus Aquicultor sp.]